MRFENVLASRGSVIPTFLRQIEEGTDIEIEYTGVRPGEKLYEEVFFGHEDVRSTHHPKVLRTISTVTDARTGESRGRVLTRLPRTRDNQDEGLVRGEGRRCWVLGLGDGIGIGEGAALLRFAVR